MDGQDRQDWGMGICFWVLSFGERVLDCGGGIVLGLDDVEHREELVDASAVLLAFFADLS